jgi:hypothetical protein
MFLKRNFGLINKVNLWFRHFYRENFHGSQSVDVKMLHECLPRGGKGINTRIFFKLGKMFNIELEKLINKFANWIQLSGIVYE